MATTISAKLQNFKFERILHEDPSHRKLVILGRIAQETSSDNLETNDDLAILVIEKTHFEKSETNLISSRISAPFTNATENDIYTWFSAFLLKGDYPDVRIQMTFPATLDHIAKYSPEIPRLVAETENLYHNKIKPYIDSLPVSKIQWVYNILEHKKETESIVAENIDPQNGFIILPDMKWDSKSNPDQFYLQLIVTRRDIRSLRDLRGTDIQFLKDLQIEIARVVFENFGIDSNQIRAFIHYPPSYYHFHIHITPLTLTDLPSATIPRAHLLETVISNLEFDPEYYKKITLHYSIGENHPIWKIL
ncbi:hypothetical protein HK098_003142 [Nowakowskiella sp. JEL0407]|nr:hypothetical protein HK098_003142 [Nowakowskiella sp. JEL0407]